MRALILAMLIVAMLAGVARADDRYERGRRKQKAGIALLVVGSALVTIAPPLFLVGNVRDDCAALVGDYCGQSPLYYVGFGFAVGGAVMQAIGLPLYIAGTVDVDRWRDGKTASLATVRF
jgi:drug/metabolite transporter (DMT)-like permease